MSFSTATSTWGATMMVVGRSGGVRGVNEQLFPDVSTACNRERGQFLSGFMLADVSIYLQF